MAGGRVHYTIIGEQAIKALTELDLRTRNPYPVMQDFAGYMPGSTQKTFDVQGRPSRWAPLKLATLTGWAASRKTWTTKSGGLSKKGREALAGRKILTDTSRLRNSIRFAVVAGGKGVKGYTNVAYAAIQHKGGKTKPHLIRPRSKKALAWPGGGYPVKVVHHPGSVIPARPFLMFQEREDVHGYLFPRLAEFVEGIK